MGIKINNRLDKLTQVVKESHPGQEVKTWKQFIDISLNGPESEILNAAWAEFMKQLEAENEPNNK